MYAIVDIETTGGYAAANGITEISIEVFDGHEVVERFETLINPLQPIPRYIQSMTGITDEMVRDAPLFSEAAEKIHQILQDKIFVAHNVNFDYSFVKSQLAACDLTLNSKRLCTIRLSRKIFPGLPSYSLGNLCHSLGIPTNNRHRAGGDTEATVSIFKRLLENDQNGEIVKSLLKNSKEQVLPPHVPREQFTQLPYTPGVYYFHNERGKIIYIGKAKNIRYRVNSHFTGHSDSRQRQNFLRFTYKISFQPCATELMARILESAEIKKHWPLFNYSQKNAERLYGIYQYEDQKGYQRLAIEKYKKNLQAAHTFHYLTDGHSIMRKLIRDYHLCPKLCFMQADDVPCEGTKENYCLGACEQREDPGPYNKRVKAAVASLSAKPTFAIVDEGLGEEEYSCILVLHGSFYGMGYVPQDVQLMNPEDLKEFLTPYKENIFIRNIIYGYAAGNPDKVKSLSLETAV